MRHSSSLECSARCECAGALLLSGHQHHAVAEKWFSGSAATEGWATCTVTELGAIRVCSQLGGAGLPPVETADRVLLLTSSISGYGWWPDMESPTSLPEVRSATGGKQVMDRYLLGFARRNGGRLVTFDRALGVTGGDDVIHLAP